MPCRVGMTTDPETRRAYWGSHVVGFKNWRILKTFSRKAEAQEYETQYATTVVRGTLGGLMRLEHGVCTASTTQGRDSEEIGTDRDSPVFALFHIAIPTASQGRAGEITGRRGYERIRKVNGEAKPISALPNASIERRV